MNDSKKTTPQRFARLALKLGLTGLVVALIGFIVVSNEKGEVQEADADVYWFNAMQSTKHAKFVETIKDYDFEPPQMYKWNGMQMFVAKKHTEQSPHEVLYDLQAEFFKSGVNGDVFSQAPDPSALGDENAAAVDKFLAGHAGAEFVAGSMIPTSVSADHTAMVGIDTVGEASNLREFIEQASEAHTFDDVINSTRYVEAFRNGTDRQTTVLAIWTDREMKLSQLVPEKNSKYHRAIPDIPTCMGCDVTSQIEGEGDQAGFLAMSLDARDTPRGVVDFYRRALPSRGWQVDETSRTAEAAIRTAGKGQPHDDGAVFRKETRQLVVHAYPADDGVGTRVSLTVSPK